MARSTDTAAHPDGQTRVIGVNSVGQPVDGVFPEGNQFFTAKWSVRARQPGGAGCPTWLKTVVVGSTPESAVLGAGLAGTDEVLASSSQCSENVVVVIVDETGAEKSQVTVPFALVVSDFPSTGVGNEPRIAGTVWFSNEPFDRYKTPVAAQEEHCIKAAKDAAAEAARREAGPDSLHEKDVRPALSGTEVTERDGTGRIVPQGRLNGKRYRATAWAFRKQTRVEGCPLWLTKIVISETLDGARKGANLALPSEELPGSSFVSRDMEMIVVDADGKEQNRFIANFGVVASVFPRQAGSTSPPVAAELWFSDSALNESLEQVQAARAVCAPLQP